MQTWDDLRSVQQSAGHRIGLRKLTMDQAEEIRARFAANPTITIVSLSREFGVADHAIYNILTNRTYKHSADWFTRRPRHLREIEPMPCRLLSTDHAANSRLPTATESSNAAHMTAWWAMDARIQAANDAWDALDAAAD